MHPNARDIQLARPNATVTMQPDYSHDPDQAGVTVPFFKNNYVYAQDRNREDSLFAVGSSSVT